MLSSHPNIGRFQPYRCVYVASRTGFYQKILLWSQLRHDFPRKYLNIAYFYYETADIWVYTPKYLLFSALSLCTCCHDFLRKYHCGHIYDQNITLENLVVPLMSAYRGYRSGLVPPFSIHPPLVLISPLGFNAVKRKFEASLKNRKIWEGGGGDSRVTN